MGLLSARSISCAALLAVLLSLLLPSSLLSRDSYSVRSYNASTVLITGASSGIGAELARQYGAAGASLVLAARRTAELELVAAQALAAGASGVLVVQADMAKAEDCERLVAQALQRFGRLDVLVLNAAMFDEGLFIERSSAEQLDATLLAQFRVNVMGPAYTIRAALPALEASAGTIVEVSSGSIKIAVPFHPGYGTTKTALHGFTKHLSAELSLLRSPVRIVTAILGMIATPEVTVHEGLRPLAYPVEDCARGIILGAQSGERLVYVPSWTAAGVQLSFFSQFLEHYFMSAMYTLRIPQYVQTLQRLSRDPAQRALAAARAGSAE
jgi:NAD(P)-dependent dehydrogenase (short-subunit alcohol dehydrogenase family)